MDFASLRLTPVGANCRLTVNGVVVFSGGVTGEAVGSTRALVHAPCDAVLANPPGTYGDVFRFDGQFRGVVAGQRVSGAIVYAGVARPGGHIDARIRIRDGVLVNLRVEAMVAQGGSYEGTAVVRR